MQVLADKNDCEMKTNNLSWIIFQFEILLAFNNLSSENKLKALEASKS